MKEYQGRINLSKDEMLFVVNEMFEENVKESTTKENLLKIVSSLYCEKNYDKIIKLLPYEGYEILEKLMKYIEENGAKADINEFEKKYDYPELRMLERAMIVVMRAKYGEYDYSLNEGVLQNLKGLFDEKYKNKAKRYGLMEKLILGVLYSYGVVNFEFMRKEISRHMKEIISSEEIEDLIFYRLNLNPLVTIQGIHWDNINEVDILVTYLEEETADFEDIVDTFMEQKSRNWDYKIFTKKELLKRDEYVWNELSQKLCDFLSEMNEYFWEYHLNKLSKAVEVGINVMPDLLEMCKFNDEDEMEEFIQLYTEWYNNHPQYPLCGYTPIELATRG